MRPKRGEVYLVNLNPTKGAEIAKRRPAVVVSADGLGVIPLKWVVPITTWQDSFDGKLWMVPVEPTSSNGLTNKSALDVLQLRSLDVSRFETCLGAISATLQETVAAAIAIVADVPQD